MSRTLRITTLLIASTAFIMTTSAGCEPTDSSTVETVAKTVELRFDVEGMTCDGCVNAINETVKRMDGVIDCEASLEKNAAVVTVIDSSLGPAIAQTINDLEGYEATIPLD